jgi:hypothetical protein
MNRMSTCRPQPDDHEGYLMKKSPAMFTGWQKRYFVLREPGELSYWPTVSSLVIRVLLILMILTFLSWISPDG